MKFLESKINNVVKRISFDDIDVNAVCVDLNIFIYKYVTAIRRSGKDLEHNGRITSHLVGLRNQINRFRKIGIDMIYVFDGKPPREKTKELKKRSSLKKKAEKEYKKTKSVVSYQKSFYITNEILDDARELFELMGVKYIDINLEADTICAALVRQNIVDCVISTDYDIMIYGGDCLVININYKKEYFEFVELKDVLKGLNIKYEQLVDIVVLSGCDYCDKIDGMTLNKAYKLIKEESFDKIIKKFSDNVAGNIKNAKNIFMKKEKIKKSWINESIFNEIKLKKFLEDRGMSYRRRRFSL